LPAWDSMNAQALKNHERNSNHVRIAGLRISSYTVALLAIVILALFLRVYHWGTQSVWYDEAFSIWVAKMDLAQLARVTAADTHPPLYFLILHGWIGLFGDSELAVRFLSALFGVLAIPMMYMLGKLLFDSEAGLWGALILAMSSFNIAYSQEARMYTLMLLLALLSMYFFIRPVSYTHLTLP